MQALSIGLKPLSINVMSVKSIVVGAGFACFLVADPASADVVYYSSDADFIANADFAKVGGANVKRGNLGANGDWEYAVVDPNDTPYQQGQLAWPTLAGYAAGTDLVANSQFSYTFSAAGVQTLALRDINGNSVGNVSTVTGTVTLPPIGSINTLAVRARADSSDYAVVGPGGTAAGFRVNFTSGGFFDMLRVVGDSNAEYAVLIDDRLAGGFWITDDATFLDTGANGSGAVPMWQFKVGVTPVPLPAAAWLLLSGIGALGAIARRHRSSL